jgi:hypothetical protein
MQKIKNSFSFVIGMAKKKSKNKNLLVELWAFLKVRKVWWLTPIIIMLLLVAILIIFGQSTAVSPFVYALF